MSRQLRYLRLPLGILASVIVTCATAVLPIAIMLFFCLRFLIPFKKMRVKYMQNFIYKIPLVWCWITEKAIFLSTFGYWELPDTSKLQKNKHYLIIANHRSWFDIIVIAVATYRKVPPFRFFMKKELLWQLPVTGIMCHILGFPFLKRHSRKDIQQNPALRGQDIATTRSACRKFRDYAVTFVNFPEGTRFTAQKHETQSSKYTHLLNPRARGCSIIINELKDQLGGIIDLTLCYSEKKTSLLKFFLGKVNKISCKMELLPVSNEMIGDIYQDSEYKAKFQNWINGRWDIKDDILNEFYKTHE